MTVKTFLVMNAQLGFESRLKAMVIKALSTCSTLIG